MKNNKKKICIFLCIFALMTCLSCFAVSAEVPTSDITSWTTEITTLFEDFNIANLTIILGVAIAISVPFFLFWFAFRMIKRRVTKGMKKGSL